MDVVDTATRSRMMAGIQGKNTKPETILRKALHSHGFRYRIHAANLPGKPDIVFAKHSAVCFVHGCFWHRHPGCRYATTPATNRKFWIEKLEANRRRDEDHIRQLSKMGWRVAVIWECDLRKKQIEPTINHLTEWLCGVAPRFYSDKWY